MNNERPAKDGNLPLSAVDPSSADRGMESRDDVVAMSGFAGFFRHFASPHIHHIFACTFA